MKIPFISLVTACSIFLFSACSDSKNTSDNQNNSSESSSEEPDGGSPADENNATIKPYPAIALWNMSIRTEPGRGKGDWVVSLDFGESVTVTADSAYIEDEDRLYRKVTLSDGKTGWAYTYLLAEKASKAVALGPVVVCKRPDLSTMLSEKIQRGQVVAVSNDQKEGWSEVATKEKKIQGWVKGTSNLSSDDMDVTVAILLDKALSQKEESKKIKMLENLVANDALSSSSLHTDAKTLLEEMQSANAIEDEIGAVLEEEMEEELLD